MKTLNGLSVVVLCALLALWTLPAHSQEGAMADAQAKAAEMQDKAGAMADKAGEMADKAGAMADKAEAMMEKADAMAGDAKQEAGGMMAGGEANADSMAAMMAAWQKAMTPGEPHAHLAEAVGTWKMTLKSWMDPTGEPMVSEGTAERSMLLDGRVLEERVTSEFMGMPFHGIGQTGYDNVSGQYWSTWVDNMSTGLAKMNGSADPEAGTVVFTGEMADPATGQQVKMKMVMRQEGPDREVSEFFQTGPDGNTYRSMEIVYERQK